MPMVSNAPFTNSSDTLPAFLLGYWRTWCRSVADNCLPNIKPDFNFNETVLLMFCKYHRLRNVNLASREWQQPLVNFFNRF